MNIKLILVLCALVKSFAYSKLCYTPSCVRSAADIIEKLNTAVDPCDDFYDYACGSFSEETVPPDEESTVDSLSKMGDKLQEFLLTLLSAPISPTEPVNHKLVKLFYQSCINYDKINERGNVPLMKILKFIGGFPMIDDEWSESDWEWEDSILKLRQYILNKSNNIFDRKNGTVAISENNNLESKQDLARLENNLKTLMFNIAITLGTTDIDQLNKDIEDLVDFEKNLGDYLSKFNSNLRRKRSATKPIKEFQKMYRLIVWMEMFAPNALVESSISTEDVPDNFNFFFYEFLRKIPKRTLANYVGWRVLQASIFLMGENIRLVLLEFETVAFGKEDLEQRWKFCTSLVAEKAAVAVGQYYINEFFSESDKTYAEQMVEDILEQYIERIKTIEWIDDLTRESTLNLTNSMLKFIGYHANLKSTTADNYYNELHKWDKDNFLELALSYSILSTDKQFTRLYSNAPVKLADWTKYSIPATINAFYNSKDNSIQFPAAILQFPFFDRLRPDALNFGAIGSIIGHEISHAFDDLSSKVNKWLKKSRDIYQSHINCLVEQYDQYRVPEVEKHFNIKEFHINGQRTIKENVADNGGVKLAFMAFKKRLLKQKDFQLIGLESFSDEKIFFLSFAQAFCSVERPAKMKSKVETVPHALNKFRVIGPLSNMPEFSISFNCSINSRMNPAKKCMVW